MQQSKHYKYTFTGQAISNAFLTKQIDVAAQRLFDKLKTLDLNLVQISDYNRNYLKHDHLSNLTRTLQKYSYILSCALEATKQEISQATFLAYGDGIGMLALLAREAGVGQVIYNDIYEVSCNDAHALADALGIPAHHYICGDIDQVIEYIHKKSITCHAIASYDVIEHVYDIDLFFKKIPLLSSEKNFAVFMSSGANQYNPRIRRALQKHHHEHEYENRPNSTGHKKRDCLESFFTVRSNMIKQYAPKLSADIVAQLARATRGKMQQDIHAMVDWYTKTNTMPAVPAYTDTCDPYTGNWSEHLMDAYKLKNILGKQGFDARVLCGYYGHQNNIAKRLITRFLNAGCSYLPTAIGLRIAPFYTIFGVRK